MTPDAQILTATKQREHHSAQASKTPTWSAMGALSTLAERAGLQYLPTPGKAAIASKTAQEMTLTNPNPNPKLHNNEKKL